LRGKPLVSVKFPIKVSCNAVIRPRLDAYVFFGVFHCIDLDGLVLPQVETVMACRYPEGKKCKLALAESPTAWRRCGGSIPWLQISC
jgi:hypothetical protein